MMYLETGTTAGVKLMNGGSSIRKATDVHDGRIEGYGLSYPKTLDATPGRIVKGRPRAEERRTTKTTPEERYCFDLHYREACENARVMQEAVQDAAPRDVGLAGMELVDSLRELWRLRVLRSDEWGMVLNFLQIALAGEVFEDFGVETCRSIRTVVEKHLRATADGDDVEASIELFEGAGLDPWKAMAGFRQ